MSTKLACVLGLLFVTSAFAVAPPPTAPEIDAGSVSQGVAILLGSGLLYRFRRGR